MCSKLVVQQYSRLRCDVLLTLRALCTVVIIPAAAAQTLRCSCLRRARRFACCGQGQPGRMHPRSHSPSHMASSPSCMPSQPECGASAPEPCTCHALTLTAALSAARCCRAASRRTRTFSCHRRRLISRPSPRPCIKNPGQQSPTAPYGRQAVNSSAGHKLCCLK